MNFIEQEATVRANPLRHKPGQPDELGCADFVRSQWTLRSATAEEMPGQDDVFNCGVFVIMLMDLISLELPLLFDATDIELCRKKICLYVIDLMTIDLTDDDYDEIADDDDDDEADN